MDNQAAFLTGDRVLEIRATKMPFVGKDDLLIQTGHVGICGSDASCFLDPTRGGHRSVPFPIILGHECAGTVIGVGSDVTGFAVGDRVAMEPGVPCMKCSYCMKGQYNLCVNMDFMGATPYHRAAFQRYISHPAMMCFKLPDNVSTLEGAMVEPLAVGMHAATRAQAEPGKSVLILGSGCIGLMVLMACKARGVSDIIIADIFENRLNKAREIGVRAAINVGETDLFEEVMRLTAGKGADIVFEAAGNEKTCAQAQTLACSGGKIAMVGNVHDDVPYNFMRLSTREIDILGVFRYRNVFAMLVEAIAAGTIDVKTVCTDLYKFEDIQKGFDDSINRKMSVLKAVIEF